MKAIADTKALRALYRSLDAAADACDLQNDPDYGLRLGERIQAAPPRLAGAEAANALPPHLRRESITRPQDAAHGGYFRDSRYASRVAAPRTTKARGANE